jgi:thiamine-monophosphate kinase
MGIRSGYFVQKHKRVAPDIQKGVVLSKYVSGMIDISDGLVIDTNRILEASGCGGLIEYDRIPVSDDMRKTCLDAHLKEEELVLAGGEDYVLLFTVSPDNEEKLKEEGIEYCIIGDVKSRDFGLKVQRGDVPVVLSSPGYDHFE